MIPDCDWCGKPAKNQVVSGELCVECLEKVDVDIEAIEECLQSAQKQINTLETKLEEAQQEAMALRDELEDIDPRTPERLLPWEQ